MANEENLRPFSSEYQPKRNGRKPSHLKKYVQDHNVSTQDIRIILGGILTEIKTIEQAKEKLVDPKTPFIVKLFLKPLIAEWAKNKFDAAKFLAQYGFGMPQQEIISRNTNTNIDYEIKNMTKEERAQFKKEMIRKMIQENKDLVKEIEKEMEVEKRN